MSKYYNANRTRYLFDPKSSEPYRLSRSKIDFFIECPKCFYLDQRLGTKRPPGYPFTLNVAVDELLKKEFDVYRASQTPHPLMKTYGLSVVPYQHPDMEKWRDSLRSGVEYLHPETNLSVRGGVDDIWINKSDELLVVDYKATSKREAPTLEGTLGAQYQRQMEVYQWLLAKNGFKVSKTGYFVYVNGKKDAEAFDGKLEFDVHLLPLEGDYSWLEPVLLKIKDCLMSEDIPESGLDCDYCAYRETAGKKLQKIFLKKKSLFD
ncbi:MAG: hypothetical protein COU06_00750 [Candidatus Harrisonbacteria bacterium CG10_big_fil_rev_8_21_14_0_10_38_8]|uniref:PD-(D/E)XK endonuclease-like domain-containing protein n=1 Tax=Candidatus Harrisonbacteria bacterium CG10_big_fil_rev_8_21_14_0_10_38_8 TaxID=1974582 RepID=A0A2M6WKF0_9BACT|nr:MAG: hypothetical protein COU06_00750 [Candidatus Harrisonbacteria bacterium CG10_big_fil_rev_8_21_14_0_10_38_8]